MNESDIIYETENLWAIKQCGKYKIMLQCITHSYLIGEKPTLEAAKTFMDRMEKYPDNMIYMLPESERFKMAQVFLENKKKLVAPLK